MILNLFMFNLILEQTLLCAMTQVERAMQMKIFFITNSILKMKYCFSVILARYDSIKNVLENDFSPNFKDLWLKFSCQ